MGAAMAAIAERIEAFGHGVLARYARLNRAGRIALGVYVLSNLAVTVLIIVIGPHAAFDWLASLAEDLADRPYGWAILLSALIVTSIPVRRTPGVCADSAAAVRLLDGGFAMRLRVRQ